MCGILGGLEFFPSENRSSNVRFTNGLSKIKHRGPNDQGLDCFEFYGCRITFGHTRLSIIDLSSTGHQPMMSHDGRYKIIFNGEIYNYLELRQELITHNYSFKSNSDTEVLLYSWHLWGSACIGKLQGMFAFVVFDQLNGNVTCVRDAFGIKPLYYYHDSQSLYFASEIPALLELIPGKVTPNPQTAYNYLVAGRYDRGRSTFFNEVHQLQPGHFFEVNLKEQSPVKDQVRWWCPDVSEKKGISFSTASDQLRELFLKSISLHLRSDVPIGAALSGGLDSSAIVCAMRYLEPSMSINTFTYLSSSRNTCERHWADQVNEYVGATSHSVRLSSKHLLNDLDEMIACQGEPFGSTSIYAQYCVFREIKSKNITVTLDGQGADELLAGYHGYPEYRYRTLLHQQKYRELLSFCKKWSEWPNRNITKSIIYLLTALGPENSTDFLLNCIGLYQNKDWLDINCLKESGVQLFALDKCLDEANLDRSLISKLYNETSNGGLTSLLRHGDRNSMHWSVESRVPFLNTELSQFLFSLPESYLISPEGQTKHIFRHAMKGIVPEDILFRKDKIGFATPEWDLLIGLGSLPLDWIESSNAPDFIKTDQARETVRKLLSGKKSYSSAAWRIINYYKWLNNLSPNF